MVLGIHAKGPDAFLFLSLHYHMAAQANSFSCGTLDIDNSYIEGSIAPIVQGENPLSSGSHPGAQRADLTYCLLGSCKLRRIKSYNYLQDVRDLSGWVNAHL